MKIVKFFGVGVGVLIVAAFVLLLSVFKSIPVGPGATLVQPRWPGFGANVVVFEGTDRRVIVDSQLAPLAPILRWHLGELRPEERIVLTHWHPDHSGGYVSLRGSGKVLASAATVLRLSSDQTGKDLTEPGSLHNFKARPADALPDVISSIPTTLGEVEIVAFSAAHTEQDLVVRFPAANVVALGDLVWPNSFPFVDLHTGGGVDGLIAAVEQTLAQGNSQTRYIPGHGDVMTQAELQLYLDMLTESREAARCANGDQRALLKSLAHWQDWASDLVPLTSWSTMLSATSISENHTCDQGASISPPDQTSVQFSETFDLSTN